MFEEYRGFYRKSSGQSIRMAMITPKDPMDKKENSIVMFIEPSAYLRGIPDDFWKRDSFYNNQLDISCLDVLLKA